MDKSYSTAEITALLGINRQRLHQLRCGYKKGGRPYLPQLEEGRHWRYERARVVFTQLGYEYLEANYARRT